MSADYTPGLLLRLDHRQLAALAVHPLDFTMPAIHNSCITLCCWIYVTDAQPTQVIVNHGHRRWNEPGWSIYLRQGTVVCSLRVGTKLIGWAVPLPGVNSWHHVAVGIDRVEGELYPFLNGTAVAWQATDDRLDPPGPPAQQQGLAIGGYTDAAGGHFNYRFGHRPQDRIDDLRLYGYPLTDQEISRFYTPAEPPPVASFASRISGAAAPATVYLDATSSTAPDSKVTAYWWDLGDGATAEGATVVHNYPYAGQYTIRLTVLDDAHGQASCEQTLQLGGMPSPMSISPVFVNGVEGYAGFRIPSIVAAANGDLLAFAEGRVESISDSTRTIRIVCKRSQDNGRSWSPLQIVGRNLIGGEEYAAMYPSPVVDLVRGTGRIVLVYKRLNCSEWELVQGRGTSRAACVFSDDHGVTWYGERDISNQVHRPDLWPVQIPTAGHAIQLRGIAGKPFLRGRLFYIGSHTVAGDSVFSQSNYAFWSDDLGASWEIGPEIEWRTDGTTAKGLNEATAVELSDGRIMVNSRNYQHERPVGCRAVTIGEFDEDGKLHFGPARHDRSLIEPAVQAALLRCLWPAETGADPQGAILFSNPADARARRNLTVRLSRDDGQTWPVSKVIDAGPSAYSDLVVQADGRIGVLYERGNDGGIHYGRFGLDWLQDG